MGYNNKVKDPSLVSFFIELVYLFSVCSVLMVSRIYDDAQ